MTDDHNNHNTISDLKDEEVIAKTLIQTLEVQANRLDMRTLTRLEQSRRQAVHAHTQLTTEHQVNRDGTWSSLFTWGQHHPWMSAGLLALVLLTSAIIAQNYPRPTEYGDAFLLGAELPPEAFVDRGFAPWLNNAEKR